MSFFMNFFIKTVFIYQLQKMVIQIEPTFKNTITRRSCKNICVHRAPVDDVPNELQKRRLVNISISAV